MTGKNPHDPDASDRPPDRKTGGPPAEDAQEPSTTEAFDEEGAGIAPKE
ncbi:MAG: hypothetical protein QOE79_103 [Sphingomonadales bacterium]|jgi:hypothetical protein|nr:hypothetical protein [Sphingomonadales bacterium]